MLHFGLYNRNLQTCFLVVHGTLLRQAANLRRQIGHQFHYMKLLLEMAGSVEKLHLHQMREKSYGPGNHRILEKCITHLCMSFSLG